MWWYVVCINKSQRSASLFQLVFVPWHLAERTMTNTSYKRIHSSCLHFFIGRWPILTFFFFYSNIAEVYKMYWNRYGRTTNHLHVIIKIPDLRETPGFHLMHLFWMILQDLQYLRSLELTSQAYEEIFNRNYNIASFTIVLNRKYTFTSRQWIRYESLNYLPRRRHFIFTTKSPSAE